MMANLSLLNGEQLIRQDEVPPRKQTESEIQNKDPTYYSATRQRQGQVKRQRQEQKGHRVR